jgi:peptide/nickel transport system substrate-binding protein
MDKGEAVPDQHGRVNRRRRRIVGAVAALGAAGLLAACGSSSSGAANSGTASTSTTVAGGVSTSNAAAIGPQGMKTKGGTVLWAEAPAATPNYIFPLAPFADFSVANLSQFQELMYRPLYWFGDNDSPTVDYDKSVGQTPVWSNGDKTVTITLNDYTWSDGEKMEARDVVFWMNLLKAEKSNWAAYVPGYFPDNVVSTTYGPAGPTGNVVVFNLNKSYNPTWFLYNEISQVTPIPMAWDVTSATGTAPSATSTTAPDLTAAGAKAVYTYLTTAAKSINTYATSPLWDVVDGPWKLSALTSQGRATFLPNPKYTGPDKPVISEFVEVPFTTDTAEYDSVKAGTTNVQLGYIPSQDATASQIASVKAEGYTPVVAYPYAFNYIPLNFTNPQLKAAFNQLYVREALQETIDQAGWIKAYFNNLAAPTYGPVPVEPPNNFSDAYEKSDPYPFSVSNAKSLLTSHGWTVTPGSAAVCNDPTLCGAGIAKGTALSINLLYASGSVPLTDSMNDWKSEAALAGIVLNEKQGTFDTVIGDSVPTSKTWQMGNWGGGWVYAPDYYASGEELYATGAGSNAGSYSSPEANKLILATTTVGAAQSQPALDAYQDYIAKELPVIFQPAPATEDVVSTGLGGVTINVFFNLDPEDWWVQKS